MDKRKKSYEDDVDIMQILMDEADVVLLLAEDEQHEPDKHERQEKEAQEVRGEE